MQHPALLGTVVAMQLTTVGLPALGLILDVIDEDALVFYRNFDLFEPFSSYPALANTVNRGKSNEAEGAISPKTLTGKPLNIYYYK